MSVYRRILVAVDLTDDSRSVAMRACEIARLCGASVQLLHVVGFVPVEPLGDPLIPAVQMDDQMMARARDQIDALTRELGLAPGGTIIANGSARGEIVRHARELAIDLIVIGCHERHGLSLLVHRTEDSVLHGAPCDVLAVRMPAA